MNSASKYLNLIRRVQRKITQYRVDKVQNFCDDIILAHNMNNYLKLSFTYDSNGKVFDLGFSDVSSNQIFFSPVIGKFLYPTPVSAQKVLKYFFNTISINLTDEEKIVDIIHTGYLNYGNEVSQLSNHIASYLYMFVKEKTELKGIYMVSSLANKKQIAYLIKNKFSMKDVITILQYPFPADEQDWEDYIYHYRTLPDEWMSALYTRTHSYDFTVPYDMV